MFLIALMSLSAVPTLSAEFISLSAENCNCLGTINFIPLIAVLNPLSSRKAAMSISDCSNDVSFKSASVANLFCKNPPD